MTNLTRTIHALLILSATSVLSACSGFLADAVVARPPMRPGTSRQDVIAILGEPRKSGPTIPLPRDSRPGVSAPARSIHVGLCDEYSVSGLVQLPGDAYRSEWNIYPAVVILTGGAIEAVVLPVTSADLARLALIRYRLRLWYDPREHLLGYERR